MDLPIKNGGSFHSYVNVYQRVNEVSPRIGFQLFYLWLGGAKHVFFVQGFGGVDPWLDQTELDWRSFNGSGYLNELNTKWFIMLTMLTMFIYVHRCSYIYISDMFIWIIYFHICSWCFRWARHIFHYRLPVASRGFDKTVVSKDLPRHRSR